MIRIRFEIDQKSPFLGILKGTMYVEEILGISSLPDLIFKCKFMKDQNSLGYKAFSKNKPLPYEIFKSIKSVTDQMIHSYWQGMKLEDSDYCWLPTEGPESVLRINNLHKSLLEYKQEKSKE
jgi:hypothetical protein